MIAEDLRLNKALNDHVDCVVRTATSASLVLSAMVKKIEAEVATLNERMRCLEVSVGELRDSKNHGFLNR